MALIARAFQRDVDRLNLLSCHPVMAAERYQPTSANHMVSYTQYIFPCMTVNERTPMQGGGHVSGWHYLHLGLYAALFGLSDVPMCVTEVPC